MLNETQKTVSQTETIKDSSPGSRVPVTLDILLEMRFPDDITISSDGKKVAFVVWENVPDEPKRRGRIWAADTSGGEAQPFSKGKRGETCPRWSPDGKQLAFISQAEGEKEKPQLYLMPAEGGDARQVCKMPNGISDLAWAPDGSRIAFISLEGEEPKNDPKVISPGRQRRLWTVRPDHTIPEPVVPDGISVWEYSWSPDSKQLALYYATGPGDTDWYRGQIGVIAAGYAVFRPNMRGSWGHGTAFADAVLGDMGGKDFQDILNGVEYLVRQGLVDGSRVGIGGWSNGGYLTAWAVTQSNRFKAAMMGAGISDWHNMHAQTNIADADILLLAADPLENPEVYRKHSPMTYAGRVTTPTLILHGEDDPAVPVAQAYAFYRALRERNVPVELVVYPREGHGLSEKAHLRDAIERQLRWFERYLQ